MLKLSKARRSMAVTVAALALAGAATVTTAGTAQASSNSCGSWINIGSPGNLTVRGTYAGQVEQQFLPYCGGGGAIRAHFQWSYGFRTNPANAGSTVDALIIDSNSNWLFSYDSGDIGVGSPDVYSTPVDVHYSPRDEYQAAVFSGDNCPTSEETALGSLHWYYNGGDYGQSQEGWCY
ncbi:hypothetical protein [Streptacidiphilus jiangxiensis]|uniref:Secreted protein n=1 Tax=Streptacidiphilus jiangxiensis TaxID=235985 RepID=A0A1H7ZPB3_STRJI|nr:hypothetical protein [Streptacidiphilus jiangxiensis]SEM60136.1 hypothetical protein SAMN05414137_13660 [Streptacidiphilus jiangxiensis]